MRIAETFISRQGEGCLTGTESFFIRTSGCNLRCWFCDTPYASWHPEGDWHSVDELVAVAIKSGTSHAVLTGGEPLLSTAVPTLCKQLRRHGIHLTIETAGTVDREVECDLMSISPKFRSSGPNPEEHPTWSRKHEERRKPINTIRNLIERSPAFQLKFVVDSEHDCDELVELVDAVGVQATDVWVMPQGTTVESLDTAKNWLEPWCVERNFRYCDRMQIRWYGNRRGT